MKAIYKYPFAVSDHVDLLLPSGAVVLHIDHQRHQPEWEATAWALVDDEAPGEVSQRFRVYGTGRVLPDDIDPSDYVTTWQAAGFVWHLFREASE